MLTEVEGRMNGNYGLVPTPKYGRFGNEKAIFK